MNKIKLVDPPYGHRYGFPKQYVEADGTEPKDLIEWLIRNGYPKSEIDSLGESFYCQWQEVSVEIPKIKRVLSEHKHNCNLFIGFAGTMYLMTDEERDKEDLGFFKGIEVVSNHTYEEILNLWNNRVENHQFISLNNDEYMEYSHKSLW
jgi:hypothetical protein